MSTWGRRRLFFPMSYHNLSPIPVPSWVTVVVLMSPSCALWAQVPWIFAALYCFYLVTVLRMKSDLLLLLVFAAVLGFACDFGWANDPSFCSWTSEDTGSRWQIQSSGTPTLNTGPNMDHTGESPARDSSNPPYNKNLQPSDTVPAEVPSPCSLIAFSCQLNKFLFVPQADQGTSSTRWRRVLRRRRWLGSSAPWSAPRTRTSACPFGTTCSGRTSAPCTSSSASRRLRGRQTSCCGRSVVTRATAGEKVASLCRAPTNPIR